MMTDELSAQQKGPARSPRKRRRLRDATPPPRGSLGWLPPLGPPPLLSRSASSTKGACGGRRKHAGSQPAASRLQCARGVNRQAAAAASRASSDACRRDFAGRLPSSLSARAAAALPGGRVRDAAGAVPSYSSRLAAGTRPDGQTAPRAKVGPTCVNVGANSMGWRRRVTLSARRLRTFRGQSAAASSKVRRRVRVVCGPLGVRPFHPNCDGVRKWERTSVIGGLSTRPANGHAMLQSRARRQFFPPTLSRTHRGHFDAMRRVRLGVKSARTTHCRGGALVTDDYCGRTKRSARSACVV